MKKTLLTTATACILALSALAQGTLQLSWSPYPQNTNIGPVTIQVFALPGTNTVFAPGNTNAVFVSSTSSTNNFLFVSNLWAGTWSFVSNAADTNGDVSVNSNIAIGYVPLQGVSGLRIGP